MSPAALACPASLKGVLAAGDAADALCEGLGAGSVALPVADGGEGTLEVLHAALGGDWRTADVVDAFGRPRRARWLSLADGTAALDELAPFAELPGAGAAGGLGARFAALGAELVPGADRLLELIGLRGRLRDASFVVTGEGTVDRTTAAGKAPGAVARLAAEAGVRCVVFGGRVVEPVGSAYTVALSGDPSRARQDLVALGRALRELLDPPLGGV